MEEWKKIYANQPESRFFSFVRKTGSKLDRRIQTVKAARRRVTRYVEQQEVKKVRGEFIGKTKNC